MIRWLFNLFLGLILIALFFVVLTKSLPPPGTIPVLMYHSIGSREDAKERKNFVSRESFSRQMGFLHSFGFRVISLEEYKRILKKEIPAKGREVVLTFDDANESFIQEAWPILKKYNFPVSLFVVSQSAKNHLNGSMTLEDFQDLIHSGLVTIGSNTRTHPFLPEVKDISQLEDEIKNSKTELEDFLKTPVNYFSYPNGDIDDRVLEKVHDAKYHLAFTTSYHKLCYLDETPFSITRMNISRSADNPIIFWAKVVGLYQTHKAYWQDLKIWLRDIRF